MYKLKRFLKRIFTPVTIMLIPHDSKRTINLKIPSVGVISSILLWLIGSIYVLAVAVDTIKYYDMKNKVNFYTEQFKELNTTISALKKAEAEFRRLLSFGSKTKIIENIDVKPTDDAGSLDMEAFKEQIKNTVESVEAIKDYLRQQKNMYMATPSGWPVEGRITSIFGNRKNPVHGNAEFHPAVDIATTAGTPVRATADGIVSFSGWSGGNGNLVVVEHGFGYTTLYAHNKSNAVSVGQKIKSGDIIAHVGSTGNTTGPHLHYEIWHNGKAVNPMKFLQEAKDVSISKEKR